MRRISISAAAATVTAMAVATLAGSPAASADPPGCLPLDGTQLHANSFDNTNYYFITYTVNVDYWYQDGSVNWHKTVNGGSLNLVHNDSTGNVPATPGATVTIPGASAGGVTPGRSGIEANPILVTVCSK